MRRTLPRIRNFFPKMFYKNLIKQSASGISFIEVMIAVVIISIASLGLLMGVVHARSELHAIEIRELATNELVNYMEFWKGRVADGSISMSNLNGDLQGQQVYLVGNSQSQHKIEGRLFYDIDHLDSETEYGDTNYERYNIDCWIEWKDYFQTGKNENQLVTKARKLSTVMSVF